jgi:MFS family permease
MMGAQSLNAAAAVLMATIVFRGAVEFWHFIVLGVFNGVLLALSMPSRQSIIPTVVGEARLMNAIALNSASMNLSRILGPALSGGLIALFHVEGEIPYTGVGIVYVLIALLYAGAAGSVRFVSVDDRSPPRPRQGVWQDIAEGFRYVRDTRLMFGLVVMGTFPMMFGMPMQSLMPAFSRSVLHGGPDDLGLLMTALGLGAIVGTLALARAGDYPHKGRALFVGCAVWAFFIGLFTFAGTLVWAAVFTALAGIFSSSLTALNRTMMQLEAPPDMRGRIMSFDQMAHGLMPVGILPIGFLSDVVGVQHALQVSAALLLALTVLAYWRLPEVWAFGARSARL